MRLHRLDITAFGPFADTTSIDFDALGAGGLFLLSGATGAGKSSVLDAVCFALYGAVPGERNDAKRLRCDQAAPGVPPRVVLEATLGGRRFRIERSPAWRRPKSRGVGTTPTHAAVAISEQVDDGWVTLSTRLDETGHLVTGLVGMTLTQFTQVVLLPQGRFQAFLRASSEERHRVLQQLFHTGRFEQVERWLREQRVDLQRRSAAHEAAVVALLHRVSETSQAPVPDPGPPGPADGSEGLAWSGRQVDLVCARATEAQDALPGLADAATRASASLAEGRRLADLRRRHDDADREHADLLARADEMAALAQTLHRADEARAVEPVRRLLAEAEARRRSAATAVVRAREAVTADLGERTDLRHLAALLEGTVTAAAVARSLVPREAERAVLREQLEQLTLGRDRQAGLIAALGTIVADAPDQLARLRLDVAEALEAEGSRPALLAAVADAQARLQAGHTLIGLRNDLVAAQLELNAAVTTCLALSEELLALRQARLDGMAAEIAQGLAAGGCCPVCGSEHHPHPARPAPDAPDASAEKELRRRLDDAEFERQTRAERARDLETAAALSEQAAGTDDLDALAGAVARAVSRLSLTEQLAATATGRADRLGATEGVVGEATRRLAREMAAAAEAESRLAMTEQAIEAITAELDTVLSADGETDLGSLIVRLDRRRETLVCLDAAERELVDCERSAHAAGAALEGAARDAGFAEAAEAVAALQSETTSAHQRGALEAHAQRLAAVAAVLGDSAVVAATQAPAADIRALESAHAGAASALSDAQVLAQRESAALARLRDLDDELRREVALWQPLRTELELVSGLASFVDGKSPDNRLQMRLSAYVLGYRLGQVVDAANARLAHMSDQRYSLEHVGRRGAGERRGGLSLLVRDDWSGESRDPATLSGGETFVVSLALALGLADVITTEVGGAALDTLFVDEGFGSLDADTLDDVMDTLDSLRDGGRVVGVVSHVAELRDRIPHQLVVLKSRAGSSTVLRT